MSLYSLRSPVSFMLYNYLTAQPVVGPFLLCLKEPIMNVLYLGATGVIGSQVIPILKEHFNLTLAAFGGGEIDGLPVIDLDITDFEATEALVKAGNADGQPFDAIVNSAIAPHRDPVRRQPGGRHLYNDKCIQVNAGGAYHVFEAAARAEVPKVVYIASLTAVLGPPRPDFIGKDAPVQTGNVYAASKVFGEHVGRYYAYRDASEGPNLKVLCLRLGQPYKSFTRSDENWATSQIRGIASHYEDIARAIDLALKLDAQYGIFPIVSASDTPVVDPKAYADLGYQPAWNFTAEGISPIDPANEVIPDEALPTLSVSQ
jgi:nucleoside-diphosphate-sugar epimerase